MYIFRCVIFLTKRRIDHRQWHLKYEILENKKFDVKKLTENIGSVYYCHKFDPIKCLVWRGLVMPLVFRNYTKFTGKHLWQSLLVADLRPATLLKKRRWHRCFPMNFAKFLRTPFLTEHLWWLLLIVWLEL